MKTPRTVTATPLEEGWLAYISVGQHAWVSKLKKGDLYGPQCSIADAIYLLVYEAGWRAFTFLLALYSD